MSSSNKPFVPSLKSVQQEVTAGPGAMLRHARENKQMNVDQVAAQLKLSNKMVMELEADDYSHINSLIFLKGYLRNYANIVGLGADDVIAQINPRQFEQERERPPAIEYKVNLVSRDQLSRWITLAVGGVLVALVLSWWHSHSQHSNVPLLPATHTAPVLPSKPSVGSGLEKESPVYEDHDLGSEDSIIEDVTPAAGPDSPEQGQTVESFAKRESSPLTTDYPWER